MKLIVLFALIATAIAVPLEERKPVFQPSPLDNNKPPLTADPKAQAPLAPTPAKAPLHKRDTPKATDQKTNTAPVVNTQKAAAAPSSTTIVKPTNTRQTRDTQKAQDSYQPQPSGVPQKSNVPTPTNTNAKTSNNRPARDTPKAPVNNDQKNTAPVTPQKNTAPVAANPQKQNSRNRRDTVKQNGQQQQPVTWNKDDKTKSSPPAAQQPSTLTADRKTRETPKIVPTTNDKTKSPAPQPTDANRKTRDAPKNVPTTGEDNADKRKSPVPAPQPTNTRKTRETQKNTQPTNDKAKASAPTHPEVAKVPLTSTNSRNRRDAPNPVEQSKLVPSGSVSGNVQNPSLLARKDPIAPTTAPVNHKRDTQGTNQNIRYPVPVDQVLKQKTTDNKPVAVESPAADNTKPADNSSKKV